jgi:SAM-dependent methyltransferase
MRAAVLLVLVACATPRTAPVVSAAPPQTPAPPSEAEIKRLSYAVLEAYDKADVPVLEAAFAADLWHFEGGKPSSRDDELSMVKKRVGKAPHFAKRTWSDESVQLRGNDAVFVGKATEVQGGNDIKGGYRYVGWYLLQWVRAGDAWKLRLWTWQRGGEASLRDNWNDIYRNDVGFLKEPNKLLVETVKGKRPGTALDIAMGQGRNALYLASQGWKVTGVDIADEGLRMAREEADKRKLPLTTVNTDLDKYDFGVAKWDLVALIYAGNIAWVEKAKQSVKPGGLIVVEFFAYDEETDVTNGFKQGQLAKTLGDGFDVLRDDLIEDAPDWARDRAKLVRFVARKK